MDVHLYNSNTPTWLGRSVDGDSSGVPPANVPAGRIVHSLELYNSKPLKIWANTPTAAFSDGEVFSRRSFPGRVFAGRIVHKETNNSRLLKIRATINVRTGDSNPVPRILNRTRCLIFTLVEMLVVVAIITVLAAMLLPALKNATNTARQALCISNQRQLALAFSGYQADFYDYYPSGTDADNNSLIWNGVLESLGYLPTLYRKTDVGGLYEPGGSLFCPVLQRRFEEWVGAGGRPGRQYMHNGRACTTEKCYFSYAMPYNAGDAYNPGNGCVPIGGRCAKASLGLPKISNVKFQYVKSQPTQTMLTLEWCNTYSAAVNKFSISVKEVGRANWFNGIDNYLVHNNNANVLYLDGHASPVRGDMIKRAFDSYASTAEDSFFNLQLGR